MSNAEKIISLNITQFPQNLLLPDIDNFIKVQIVNHSSKKETFNFEFLGENLNINVQPDEFKNHVEFGPGETKNIELKLTPLADGFGKLTINANWLKIIEYKVKVQKVRETVSNSKLKKILEKQSFNIKNKDDIFKPEDYFIDMNKDVIKKAEQQLKSLREEFNSAQTMGAPTSQLLEKIDAYITQLAKGYLSSNNPVNALEFALMLSNNTEQIDLYINLIRAYALKDFNAMFQLINSLHDLDIREKLYKLLALDQITINPEQAIRTGLLIQDTPTKEDLLTNIYTKIIDSNPLLALKLVKYIEDDILNSRVLFNIAKKLYEQNSQSELSKIFNSIIQLILKAYNNNLEKRKLRKESYELIENAIKALAEVENPAIAHSIIESIIIQELKEKLTKDLFNVIYVMVDDIQTKVEATSVFSQYFLLNTYVSKVNIDITNFSLSGGNVSNNILLNDFNFSVAFLSLFGFDFSIFPIMDRVYSDLRYSIKKSFAYYIFPSRNNYNEKELKTLKSTLKQFFNNFNSAPSQMLVFNLDFIPYLGKPTVIISSEQELNNSIHSKIKKIEETVNIIVDDIIFKGGIISEELTNIFPTNKTKIVNLILSYEFINEYSLFKNFIQSLL